MMGESMEVTTSKIDKVLIRDGEEKIEAHMEDLGGGQGHLTVVYDYESYFHTWISMGKYTSLIDFILSCNIGYLIGKLYGRPKTKLRADNAADIARRRIIKERRNDDLDEGEARELFDKADSLEGHDCVETLGYCDDIEELLGCEWWHRLESTEDYTYNNFEKALELLKRGLEHEKEKE
jgi:hypothetical protein